MFIGIGPDLSGWGMPFHELDRSRVLELNFLLEHGDPISKSLIRGAVPSTVRTSSGTYFDRNGIMQKAAPNTPRFAHDPVSGTPLGYLHEITKKNECLQSEAFNNWTKADVTVSSNAVVAPDDTTTMDNILETATTAVHEVQSNIFAKAAAAEAWTASIFVKADLNRDFLLLIIDDGGDTDRTEVEFNITTGAISIAVADSGTFANGVASIQDIGGGIYRCRVSATTNADAAVRIRSRIRASSGSSTYLGDITKGMSKWGGQLEKGTWASSYIKTEASAISRATDISSILLSGTPNFLAPTGTIFLEFNAIEVPVVSASIIEIDDGTTNNSHEWRFRDTWSNSDYHVANGGVDVADTGSFVIPTGQIVKGAIAWEQDRFAFTINGATPKTDARNSGTPPTGMTKIDIAETCDMYIRYLAGWNVSKSDASLQVLTE